MSTRRKIDINGTVYEWSAGRQYVHIRKDDKLLVTTTIAQVKGTTPDIVERGLWKKTTDGMLTPKEVRAFILRVVEA